MEVSDTREGEAGFDNGVLEDGTTFTTEVPNVVFFWGGSAKNYNREGRGPCFSEEGKSKQQNQKAKPKQMVTTAKDGKTKSGKEKDTPDSKGKGEHASAAMESHIEEARVCRAQCRTHTTGVFGDHGKELWLWRSQKTGHPIM